MAVQIRSKRKKNFKSNEGMQLDDAMTPTLIHGVEKPIDELSLNVRRSSRRPKPKKISDDFEEDIPLNIKIKQEPLDEDEITPTVYMSETPVFDTGPVMDARSFVDTSPGVRRETRKSFQTYLETLGYNRDFSKITEQEQQTEPWQRFEKLSGKKGRANLKTQLHDSVDTQSWPIPSDESSFTEQTNASSKIRASSRTPRPKKTFSLLEEGVKHTNTAEHEIGHGNPDTTDVQLESQKRVKDRKPVSSIEKPKTSDHRRHKQSLLAQPSSTPLGTNEVGEPRNMSDEIDGTPTRTSGRVRVPKRQFSLLEDESNIDTKREKLASPEPVSNSDVKKGKLKQSITPSDIQVKESERSSMVVKRSNLRKGMKNKKLGSNNRDSCPRKVKKIIEDINIKREVDAAESSQSETEKKTVVKKGRERIEKIVESLLLAKQSDLGSTQEQKPQASQEHKPEEKKSNPKKGVKRKRESTDNEGAKKNEKGSVAKKAKKNTEKEHIVLKLHIPHGKNKEKTKDQKYHNKHHHHHHKHRKTKEGLVIIYNLYNLLS